MKNAKCSIRTQHFAFCIEHFAICIQSKTKALGRNASHPKTIAERRE
jgi:hypothetical protein